MNEADPFRPKMDGMVQLLDVGGCQRYDAKASYVERKKPASGQTEIRRGGIREGASTDPLFWSERPEYGAQQEDGQQGQDGIGNGNDHYVKITLAMRQSANRE